MRTVGIVAEYNPFHNGHRYHIEEAKRIAGADMAVVVMSASFVQRGEPACADKFTRAGWAITGGADMVIELPDVFALSCAERFAGAGVRILSGIGIVDSICFGSETGDVDMLTEAAMKEPDAEAFGVSIEKGLSYPAALSAAMGNAPGPNDILAAEYIRAVKKYCPEMVVYAVKRNGSEYGDDSLGGEFSSAKAIRNALSRYSGETGMTPAVFDGLVGALPRNVIDDISALMKKGVFPADDDRLSDAILYRFRSMTPKEVCMLPEVAEGLENLFLRHCEDSCDYKEMLSKVKSKRYTMARLKRISMCGLLGIDSEMQDAAANDDASLYARVLAVRKGSEALLHMMDKKSSIPVVVRSADRNKLPELAVRIDDISAKAHSIRALGQPYEKCTDPDRSYRLIVR